MRSFCIFFICSIFFLRHSMFLWACFMLALETLLHAGLGNGLLLHCLLELVHAALMDVHDRGLDIAGLGQGPLGEQRPEEFIDEDAEKDDVLNKYPVRAAQLRRCHTHAEGYARLR